MSIGAFGWNSFSSFIALQAAGGGTTALDEADTFYYGNKDVDDAVNVVMLSPGYQDGGKAAELGVEPLPGINPTRDGQIDRVIYEILDPVGGVGLTVDCTLFAGGAPIPGSTQVIPVDAVGKFILDFGAHNVTAGTLVQVNCNKPNLLADGKIHLLASVRFLGDQP